MPSALPVLTKIIGAVRGGFTYFVLACYGYMMVAVGFQVLGRYVFNFQIGDATETATFAQVWMGLAGSGIAMRRGTIFAIDALPQALPLIPARILKILIAAASIGFLYVMVYGGYLLFESGFLQTSPTMLIPMWFIYAVVPISMAYFMIEVILQVIEHWDNPFQKQVMVEAEDVA